MTLLGVPQGGGALAPSLPPPAAHVHHGHSQAPAQGHAPPLSTHPPAAHVPPPLPELGPSVALLTGKLPEHLVAALYFG